MKATNSRRIPNPLQLKAFCLAAMWLTISSTFGIADDKLETLLRNAQSATNRRQDRLSNVDVRFESTQTYGAGTMPASLNGLQGGSARTPAKTTVLKSTNRVVLDPKRFRYEDNHPVWTLPEKIFARVEKIHIDDGQTLRTSTLDYSRALTTARGTINQSQHSNFLRLTEALPILLTSRGSSIFYSGNWLTEIKPTGRAHLISNVSCQEFIHSKGSLSTYYWLAPSQDFVIRRIVATAGTKAARQWDIDYELAKDESGIWFPSTWRLSTYSRENELIYGLSGKVIECTLNRPSDDNDFDLQFHIGAAVYDNRDNKEFRVDSSHQLIPWQPPGLNNELLDQQESSWYAQHPWLVLAILTLLIGVCIYAFKTRTAFRAA
jgi:hypothetical protein